MFSLTQFHLLKFRQRLKNHDVFGMFCQPLQQMTYLVLIDKFSAQTGRRKEESLLRDSTGTCEKSLESWQRLQSEAQMCLIYHSKKESNQTH